MSSFPRTQRLPATERRAAGGPLPAPRRAATLWFQGFLVASALTPVLYALFTGHIWEDYFITFRHSRNLARGLGLVYTPGERVHGFTSPLGTLLPALFDYVTRAESYLPALWMFRLASAVAFAAGGALLLRTVPSGEPSARAQRGFLALLYLLNPNAVAFAANGMETAFVLLFLGWTISLWGGDRPARWRSVGAVWAGLMWTRPDGCVYIAALAVAELVFAAPGTRPALLRSLLKSGAVCALLYLPWFVWAWCYYGSPIPNTVRAKGLMAAREFSGFRPLLSHYLHIAATVFRPIYYSIAGEAEWYPGVASISYVLGLFSAFYWLVPGDDRSGRTASFTFAALAGYLALHGFAFPWYYPPLAVLGLVAIVRGLFRLAALVSVRSATALAGVALSAIAVERACLFEMTVLEMSAQQTEIELGNRQRIGLWFREKLRPGETVYLEPIGYIGFFSGGKILDWPGLVTPEVVALARRGVGFYEAPRFLDPDWMVLRPTEAKKMMADLELERKYELAATFDVRGKLALYAYIPGINYLLYDSVYHVYRKKVDEGPGEAPAL